MLWLALVLQSGSGITTLAADKQAFEPYKQCVLDRAHVYSKTTESIADISAAAASDCRARKAEALIDMLSNSIDRENATRTTDGRTVAGSNASFDRMEALLREDVAAAVLRDRTK